MAPWLQAVEGSASDCTLRGGEEDREEAVGKDEERPIDANEVEEGAVGAGGKGGGQRSVALLDAAVHKNAVVQMDVVMRVGELCGWHPWSRRRLR